MTKWSKFVSSFPNDITVVPNPGSDLLVVPANRAELQAVAVAAAKATTSAPIRMRSDIFEALTRIPDQDERVVYVPESDAVLWQQSNEILPANAVLFPPASWAAEVEMRRQFAASSGNTETAKDALNQALDSDGPLRQFTSTIRSFGLIHDWHLFRLNALTMRLREWAQTHGLPFKEEWLGLDNPTPTSSGVALVAVGGGNKRGLVELAGLLSDDDISRISVPLDVVLRLLAAR